MSIENVLNKAQAEIENGNLWRAKEIVRSSFGNFGFEPKLFSCYGKILLAMKDNMQAGKYLFYGEESPSKAEKAAIDLFTDRHGHNGEFGLLTAAPLLNEFKPQELPGFIEARLKKFHQMKSIPETINSQSDKNLTEKLENFGCFLFFIAVVSCVVVGFVTIIKWFFS